MSLKSVVHRNSSDDEIRRRHRMNILVTLMEVCRHLEGLQVSDTARESCRDVQEVLAQALGRERAALAERRDG